MKIEHIALYVNDLEAAKDFFVRYFDACLLYTSDAADEL